VTTPKRSLPPVATSEDTLPQVFDLNAFMALLNDEAKVGNRAASCLIEAPPGERGVLLATHPEWLRIGTFDALLKFAREEVDRSPARAEQITRFVLNHIDEVEATSDEDLLLDLLRGVAHKVHATVLFRRREDLPAARQHIEEAVRVFGRRAALAPDRASARFVQAQIWHAMQETDIALEILDECEALFATRGDAHRYVQTLSQRGICYFELADDSSKTAPEVVDEYFERAHCAWVNALSEAERIGDARECARLKNSLGHWATAIGALPQARAYFVQAIEEFTALDMTGEVLRALWGVGELDAQQGNIDEAVALLRRVYQEFLDRGMAADAGLVYIDISRKLDQQRPELKLAYDACLHFARTMNAANAPPPARQAAAFLGERASSRVSPEELRADMGRVYNFFDHLKRDPAAVFDASAA